MFTGIIQGLGEVVSSGKRLTVKLVRSLLEGLELGASVSVNGVCLTVVATEEGTVTFDLLDETLAVTNLRFLKQGDLVNIERAAKFGDEIGGHLLSGHITTTAKVVSSETLVQDQALTLEVEPAAGRYIFPKGYLAVEGVSLTVVSAENGRVVVHLIPETLKRTTLSSKQPGDLVNIELDASTVAVVDTVINLQ